MRDLRVDLECLIVGRIGYAGLCDPDPGRGDFGISDEDAGGFEQNFSAALFRYSRYGEYVEQFALSGSFFSAFIFGYFILSNIVLPCTLVSFTPSFTPSLHGTTTKFYYE